MPDLRSHDNRRRWLLPGGRDRKEGFRKLINSSIDRFCIFLARNQMSFRLVLLRCLFLGGTGKSGTAGGCLRLSIISLSIFTTAAFIPLLLTPLMQGTLFIDRLYFCSEMTSLPSPSSLVYLLLLVNAVFTRSAVDQQQESTNDRENLEEVVLCKVFVGMVLVKLGQN